MSSRDKTLGKMGYVESFDWSGLAGDGHDPGDDPTGDAGVRKYYGKYRGMVMFNMDPERRGRLLVQVPDVTGYGTSSWALPCVPVGGIQTGMFVVPMQGAGVWVEYEQGDPDKPIWTGCWWASAAEVPATANLTTPGVPVVVIETPLKNALVICDSPVPPMKGPGLMLRAGPSSITIDPSGVTIIAPLITINGVTNINNGALSVLV